MSGVVPRLALLLAIAAMAPSCGDDDARGGIGRGQFAAAFVDLREATVRGTLDSASRDSILNAHGLTEAELRAYLEARGDDPEALADTWREVLDSIAARDSTAVTPDSARSAHTVTN